MRHRDSWLNYVRCYLLADMAIKSIMSEYEPLRPDMGNWSDWELQEQELERLSLGKLECSKVRLGPLVTEAYEALNGAEGEVVSCKEYTKTGRVAVAIKSPPEVAAEYSGRIINVPFDKLQVLGV